MRGCVITGVWGAGKTSVLRRTSTRLAMQGCEALITLPQAATITTHTYQPGSRSAHAESILEWLEELVGFLEQIDRRFRASSLPGHRFAPHWTPTCLLEGLGFDADLYNLPIGRSNLLAIENRLATLGLRHVLLYVPRDKVLSQCVISTRAQRGPKWARYLTQFGNDDQARAKHIENLQDHLLQIGKASPLPMEVIDTSAGNWDDYACSIAELVTHA